MPVRSLTSSVLRWPTRSEVEQAVTVWARSLGQKDPGVVKVGFRGSYANDTWGVGSDVDLIIVLGSTDRDFLERGRDFDTTDLPVPADVLVYSVSEADGMARDLAGTIWLYNHRSA